MQNFRMNRLLDVLVLEKNVKITFLSSEPLPDDDFSEILFYGDMANNGTLPILKFILSNLSPWL